MSWVKQNGNMIHFQERQLLSKLFWLPSEKGVYSEMKEFAPLGSKFFPLRIDPLTPFRRDLKFQESKHEVTKVVSLV